MSKHDIDIMIIKTKTGQQNSDYKDIACAVVNKTEHRLSTGLCLNISTSRDRYEGIRECIPPHNRVEKEDIFHAKRKAATTTAFLYEYVSQTIHARAAMDQPASFEITGM
jgi:hypothetical protein